LQIFPPNPTDIQQQGHHEPASAQRLLRLPVQSQAGLYTTVPESAPPSPRPVPDYHLLRFLDKSLPTPARLSSVYQHAIRSVPYKVAIAPPALKRSANPHHHHVPSAARAHHRQASSRIIPHLSSRSQDSGLGHSLVERARVRTHYHHQPHAVSHCPYPSSSRNAPCQLSTLDQVACCFGVVAHDAQHGAVECRRLSSHAALSRQGRH
jgi:hypothetical protein